MIHAQSLSYARAVLFHARAVFISVCVFVGVVVVCDCVCSWWVCDCVFVVACCIFGFVFVIGVLVEFEACAGSSLRRIFLFQGDGC